jgi:hypothetical protein
MPGLIVYNGPSKYDGKPIVAILIKPNGKTNRKTGDAVQQYILRADIDPLHASRIGADYSICGNCKHRGEPIHGKAYGTASNRTCYVPLYQGPLRVYKTFKRGHYPAAETIEQVQSFIGDSMLRLGTYGDPASLPDGLNELMISLSRAHVSYTHAHTVDEALGDKVARYSMVSADSIDDALRAHAKGFRTFRVIPVSVYRENGNRALLKNEIMCPSTKGVQCVDCKLCNGTKYRNGKSIAIVAHGTARYKVQ